MSFPQAGPNQRERFATEPTRCKDGFEFWIWHRARRVCCVLPDATLERLAGMAVRREAQLLAVYFRHRRRLHDAAHDEIDRGVGAEPLQLGPELFEERPMPRQTRLVIPRASRL